MGYNFQAQEARTNFLRQRANIEVIERKDDIPVAPNEVAEVFQKDGHVNLFQDLEEGVIQTGTNEEHEQEKKKEQEDYEKKIGYLTYLGQNSIEQLKTTPWYQKLDRNKEESATDNEKTLVDLKGQKLKDFHDPLKEIKKCLETSGGKKTVQSGSKRKSSIISNADDSSVKKKSKSESRHKKKKKHKKKSKKHKSRKVSESSSDEEEEKKRRKLQSLRQERLERERMEKSKAQAVLAKLRGETVPEEKSNQFEPIKDKSRTSNSYSSVSRVKQKYNSQFNPELARQNYDDR